MIFITVGILIYFLLVLSLNIVLASIDRFPSAWSYISKPKLNASRKWLLGQKQNAIVQVEVENEEQAAKFISQTFKKNGLKATISEKKGTLFVFGDSGKWNRIGAYIVHVALLTLFLGHFVALQTGFDADVRFIPGETTSEIQLIEFNLDQQNRFAVQLPFTITCTDIQQKLIDPKGSIETFNTLDWRTHIKINDPQYGVTEADVSLNNPFSYRGYRFFQAQTIPIGNARTMTLELTPEETGANPISVKLDRNGSTKLPDGTLIAYESFLPDFYFLTAKENPTRKPANTIIPSPFCRLHRKTARKPEFLHLPEILPKIFRLGRRKQAINGSSKNLKKFPLAHVLSIKYDPFNGAFIAWYFGGIGLIGALIFVFFISHRRVWALIEKNEITDKFNIVLGGNTNRNHQGFEDKFNRLVEDLRFKIQEEES